MKKVYFSYDISAKTRLAIHKITAELEDDSYEIVNSEDTGDDSNMNSQYLINSCSVFIALLDNNSPRTFYEIGYASALAKEIILMAEDETLIPDNLKALPFIKTDFSNKHYYSILLSLIKHSAFEKKMSIGKYLWEYSHPLSLRDFQISANEFRFDFKKSIISLKDFLKIYSTFPQVMENIPDKYFEYMVMRYFKNTLPDKSGIVESNKDDGFDFQINRYRGYNKALIEVKKLSPSAKVSIGIVTTLANSMDLHNAECGILITTSTFTLSAIDFAKSLPHKIELWDIEELSRKISASEAKSEEK